MVAHPQAITDVRVLEPLDVNMKAVLKSRNPAENLVSLLLGQSPQIVGNGIREFDSVARWSHPAIVRGSPMRRNKLLADGPLISHS